MQSQDAVISRNVNTMLFFLVVYGVLNVCIMLNTMIKVWVACIKPSIYNQILIALDNNSNIACGEPQDLKVTVKMK